MQLIQPHLYATTGLICQKGKGSKALEGTANGRSFWTKSVSLTMFLLRMEEAGQTSDLR
jgi:hypothetical protein